MWKNNDLKNVIEKMPTVSTVTTNGASTLLLYENFPQSDALELTPQILLYFQHAISA